MNQETHYLLDAIDKASRRIEGAIRDLIAALRPPVTSTATPSPDPVPRLAEPTPGEKFLVWLQKHRRLDEAMGHARALGFPTFLNEWTREQCAVVHGLLTNPAPSAAAHPDAPTAGARAPNPAPPPEKPAVVCPFRGEKAGLELWRWLKDKSERFNVNLVNYVSAWGKERSFPDRMLSWSESQVAQAHAEAVRKLSSIPADVPPPAPHSGENCNPESLENQANPESAPPPGAVNIDTPAPRRDPLLLQMQELLLQRVESIARAHNPGKKKIDGQDIANALAMLGEHHPGRVILRSIRGSEDVPLIQEYLTLADTYLAKVAEQDRQYGRLIETKEAVDQASLLPPEPFDEFAGAPA